MIVAADRDRRQRQHDAEHDLVLLDHVHGRQSDRRDLQIDIDTLRVGALTSIVDDGAGNSTITLGAVTGQLDAVVTRRRSALAAVATARRAAQRQLAVQPGRHRR